jgi:hypothetical protein
VENHTETKINTMCVLVVQLKHDRELLEGRVQTEGVKSSPLVHVQRRDVSAGVTVERLPAPRTILRTSLLLSQNFLLTRIVLN